MADVTSYEAPLHQAGALPVDAPPKLFGRDTTLARVYTHLKENRAVLLHGAAGVGKTAVAAKLANAYTELPGGALWLNIDSPNLGDLLARIGRAFQMENVTTSETPTAFVGAVATTLSHEKPLIVLDGTISAEVANEFVTRCATGIPVLIVTDADMDGEWTKFPLNPLEPQSALALFRQTAEKPDDDAAEIVAQLGYMPLAIVLAAQTVKASGGTSADFRALLPGEAALPPNYKALAAVWRGLNKALQGLLLVLGAAPRTGATAEMLSMMANAPAEAITGAMNMLNARRLVIATEQYGQRLYQLHTVTHQFMQPLLRGANQLETLQAKARSAVLGYARKYGIGGADANLKLAAELNTFLAVAKAASDAGDRETPNGLAMALMQGDFVSAGGYVNELRTLRRLAASQTTAFPAYTGSAPPPPAAPITPPAAPPAAKTVLVGDDFDELDEELDESLQVDETPDEFEEVEEDEDDLDALPFDDITADDDEDDLDDDDDIPAILRAPTEDFAVITPRPRSMFPALDADDEDESADEIEDEDEDEVPSSALDDFYEESESIEVVPLDEFQQIRLQINQAKAAGDRKKQAEALVRLGNLQRERDHTIEAIATYSEALSVLENISDDPAMLETLHHLSSLTLDNDNPQAAALYSARGANVADKLGDDALQIKLLTILGDARQELGENKDAARAYQRGLDVARTAGDAASEALLLYKLGYAHLDDSEPEQAIKTWEEALTQFRKQGRRDYEGRVLGGLGSANSDLERWTEAINFHTSALHIAREVKDKDEELLQLSNLGYAAVQARQLGQAVMRYRQALHLAYQSNDKQNVIGATLDLARLLVESPRHLSIADMLLDGALEVDPTSRELKRVKERIEDEREAMGENLPEQASVGGTAREYAANAYAMLDQ